MNLNGKRVLVTGAGGFIGSHLVERLLNTGCQVRAFVRYNSRNTNGFLDTLAGADDVEIVRGDLLDSQAVMDAVKGTQVVFHLGASIAIPYSYQNPTHVIQTNVLGTLHVAEAARRWSVERMVHTSTSEVYGSAAYVPMAEDHPLRGQSPYSASKIGADQIVHSFYCAYNLPVVTLRPFNAFGPRQSMRAVIPTIISQALHRDSIVLGNLSSTRDFTYVEDTACAFVRAAESDAGIGQVFNAGSGREISIGDLAAQILDLVGRDVPVVLSYQRSRPPKSEVDRLLSSSEKAKQTLGWTPQVDLRTGLTRTIDWISRHGSLYHPNEYVV